MMVISNNNFKSNKNGIKTHNNNRFLNDKLLLLNNRTTYIIYY